MLIITDSILSVIKVTKATKSKVKIKETQRCSQILFFSVTNLEGNEMNHLTHRLLPNRRKIKMESMGTGSKQCSEGRRYRKLSRVQLGDAGVKAAPG